MARIAFFPLAQVGHLHATFHLARKLRERGHEVHYLSLVDAEAPVRAQGLPFTPLFEELFPRGFRDTADSTLASDAPRERKQEVATELQRRLQSYASELLFGPTFETCLRELRPDLLLVDSSYPLPALTARRLGMAAALFSTTLPLRADAAVPPLTSPAPPPTGAWSRFKVRMAWAVQSQAGRVGYGGYVREQVKLLGERHPELGALCDFRTHLQHGPYVDLPTLVACAEAFDFPRTSTRNLHYIGPGVDLERASEPLPPEVDQDTRPLLYCSLGSLGHRAAAHRPFFQAVLDLAARRQDWRLLMAVGRNLPVSDFRIPANATVLPFAPQLAALRKASVMLTHGGLNSVKECLCLGVPMLVFPTGLDQPGNAARVVHHGLGLQGDLRRATPDTLSALLDAVVGDPGIRPRVDAMRKAFQALDGSQRGVEAVEGLLAAPGA